MVRIEGELVEYARVHARGCISRGRARTIAARELWAFASAGGVLVLLAIYREESERERERDSFCSLFSYIVCGTRGVFENSVSKRFTRDWICEVRVEFLILRVEVIASAA